MLNVQGGGSLVESLVSNIISAYNLDEIEEVLDDVDFRDYVSDPIAFCEEALKQYLISDIKKMFNTVMENPVTVAVSANAVGKTHGAAIAALWFYKCLPRSKVVTAAAPPAERNLKTKLWGEIGKQVFANKKVFERDSYTTLRIRTEDDPDHFLMGVSIPMSGTEDEREAKFSGTHAPNLFFVLDEADAIPDEVFRAIESCMSGGFCRMLIMFNPKRRSGAVYRMIQEGKCAVVSMSAFNHPNVITGRNIIDGAVTRDQTVKRINEWTEPIDEDDTVDSSCFEVPGFLVGATTYNDARLKYAPLPPGMRKIKRHHPEFSYMVLGQYPNQSSHQLISVDWIDAARTRWDAYVAANGRKPPVGVNPSMGLDAADLGEDFNTLCIRYGGFVSDIKRWSGMDIHQSAKKASLFYHEIGGVVCNVDATGVGAGIAPNMNNTYRLLCKSCGHVELEPDKDSKDKYEKYCQKCDKDKKGPFMEVIFCNAKRIMVSSSPTERTEMGEFTHLRDQIWWAVREWLRTDLGAMLPPNKNLVEELTIPEYDIKNGKIKVMEKHDMRKQLGRSPDDADALCLTFIKGEQRPRARLI